MRKNTKLNLAAGAAAIVGAGIAVGLVAARRLRSAPKTVEYVDLERYLGKWYEIARYPNRFERKCAGDATAQYSLLDNGDIRVVNSCSLPGGKPDIVSGVAKVADSTTNAKLKVTFQWPFSGDYWIVDLASDYSHAAVSDRHRKYLWILCREPHMDGGRYGQILSRLRAKGFDVEKLQQTPQSERSLSA